MAAGLRQVDLAGRLSKPQSFVSRYESGERILDLPELRQVLLAIGVPLLDFVRRFEEGIEPGETDEKAGGSGRNS